MDWQVRIVQLFLVACLVTLWWRMPPVGDRCGQGTRRCEDVFVDARRAAPVDVVRMDEPFEVEHGCQLVFEWGDGVECIYEPGMTLHLWVVHPKAAQATVTVDGEPQVTSMYAVEGEAGRGLRLVLDDWRSTVVGVHVPGEDSWSLRVRAGEGVSEQRLAEQEDAEHERQRLEGRVFLGDLDVLPDIERIIEEDEKKGLLSEALVTTLTTGIQLMRKPGRPDLALPLVSGRQDLASRYPFGRAAWSIYRGILLRASGRLVEAANALREGSRRAMRLEAVGLQVDALNNYAAVLAELGYFEAAWFWGTRGVELARLHARPAVLGEALSVVARVNLRLGSAGRGHDPIEPILREWQGLFEPGGPLADPRETAGPHLLWAELAVLEGQPNRALGHLDAVERLIESGFTRLNDDDRAHALDLRLRALISDAGGDSRRAEVEAVLEELIETDDSWLGPVARWRVAVREGAVLEFLGDSSGAIAAYERSESILDEVLPATLLGAGGSTVAEWYSEGTYRLIEGRIEQGDVAGALCTARRARARMNQFAVSLHRVGAISDSSPDIADYHVERLRCRSIMQQVETGSLAARRDASPRASRCLRDLEQRAGEILAKHVGYHAPPTCEELRERAPGELLLGLSPLGERRLVVFVEDDMGTTYRMLENPETLLREGNAEWLARILLEPFDEHLGRAEHVRVLASGAARGVDVHALPWRGRPLIESVPVVYGLDLPASAALCTPPPKGAFVLFDPIAKGAEQEAEWTAEELSKAGWFVRRQEAREESSARVLKQMGRSGFLYYMGHAFYGSAPSGWASMGVDAIRGRGHRSVWPPFPGGAAAEPAYIPLGEFDRFDVVDILMADRVPSTVVLMACATGVYDERTAYGGMSLATAFLAAGSDLVLASTRDVYADEAALVGRGLLESMGEVRAPDAGVWFQRAVRRARARGLRKEPPVGFDSSDFRMFVR